MKFNKDDYMEGQSKSEDAFGIDLCKGCAGIESYELCHSLPACWHDLGTSAPVRHFIWLKKGATDAN